MSKPNMYGMVRTCIPNSKADVYCRRKMYDRGREIAARSEPRQNRRKRRALVKTKD